MASNDLERSKRLGIFEFSRRWSGAIYVVGAWIIFLSWIASNTCRERYSTLKAEIKDATKQELLITRFDRLSSDLRTVKSQLVLIQPIPTDLPTGHVPKWQEVWSDIDGWDIAYNEFQSILSKCGAQIDLAKALTWHDAELKDVIAYNDKLSDLALALTLTRNRSQERLRDYRRKETDFTLKAFQDAVEEYCKACAAVQRRSAADRSSVTIIAENIRKAVNAELKSAAFWAAAWSYIAGMLFVCGSVVALYGQFFDKGLPKPKEASQPQGNAAPQKVVSVNSMVEMKDSDLATIREVVDDTSSPSR